MTLDVTSLYSNIPHSDGIKACEHFLNINPEGRSIYMYTIFSVKFKQLTPEIIPYVP